MNSCVPNGWKSVKLDDVAEETSDRVDNPSKSGYERFIGLEHLDSGELTVRRWGSTADLLSAMKLFKSGDILIGRRNAYLKRASKTEFDGVCSGDAYVVREKAGTIAEGLLPIILNSDSFWDYTIAHASGTMSKRAKWRDLAEYSFLLPSMEEQCRIATTLWAAEDCIVKGERFVSAAERAKQVLMGVLFSKGIGHTEFQETKIGVIPKKWMVGKFTELCQLQRGFDLTEATRKNGDVPVYSSSGVSYNHNEAKVEPPGVVTGRKGIIGKVFFVDKPFWPHDTTLWVTDFKMNDPKYVFWYLTFFKLERFDASTACPTLNRNNLTDVQIPLPPLPEQRQIAATLTRCDETIAAAHTNAGAVKALKMKLINEMLGTQKT